MNMSDKFVVSIEQNEQGKKSCTVNSIRLHSKYNPTREATDNINKQLKEKNISLTNNSPNPSLIIMIGAGLGYELDATREIFPNAQILPIYFHRTFYNESSEDKKAIFEYPNHNDVTHTLREVLQSSNLQHLKEQDVLLLYWAPSAKVWKDFMIPCLQEVKKILEIHIAEIQTMKHFISQWVRNACFHYLHISTWNIPSKTQKPIVICSAGPSLNDCLHEIKKKREHIVLMVASSALQCLISNEIYPDVVVHQDSSYYAAQYLIDVPSDYQPLMVYPLHTSRSSVLRTYPSIILNSHQEPEMLLNIASPTFPTLSVSPHATVIGTALETAWQLTDNNVFLAGFDLSIEARGNHCYPHHQTKIYQKNKLHTVDNYLLKNYFVAKPMPQPVPKPMSQPMSQPVPETIYPNIRQSSSLKMYSDWFMRWSNHHKLHRTYMLGNVMYPHYMKDKLIPTLPISPITSQERKQPAIQIQHSQHFNYTEQKKRLTKLISEWEHIWMNKHSYNTSTPSHHAIEKLKAVISEDDFHSILTTVKSYTHS